jgi:hypothetical protein
MVNISPVISEISEIDKSIFSNVGHMWRWEDLSATIFKDAQTKGLSFQIG